MHKELKSKSIWEIKLRLPSYVTIRADKKQTREREGGRVRVQKKA